MVHVELGTVQETALIPLWARAAESRRRRPIARDPAAVQAVERLDYGFDRFRHAHVTRIACVVRNVVIDDWVRAFLARHPDGAVIEVGVGLDTRSERLDNGQARWVEVDLPDVISLRGELFGQHERRIPVPVSVLEAGWATRARDAAGERPTLVLTEGMLIYLDEAEAFAVLRDVRDAFGGAELIFDTAGDFLVRHQRWNDSMRHVEAMYRWAVPNPARGRGLVDGIDVVESISTVQAAAAMRGRVTPAVRAVATALCRLAPRVAGSYVLHRANIASPAAATDS